MSNRRFRFLISKSLDWITPVVLELGSYHYNTLDATPEKR